MLYRHGRTPGNRTLIFGFGDRGTSRCTNVLCFEISEHEGIEPSPPPPRRRAVHYTNARPSHVAYLELQSKVKFRTSSLLLDQDCSIYKLVPLENTEISTFPL